jgi:chemotaxis signal transduction protein
MPDAPGTAMDDCWNRIGIRGDQSCPLLQEHVHCRHCGVYAASARQLLDRIVPDLEHDLPVDAPAATQAVALAPPALVFRLGSEWLALPSSGLIEVAVTRPVHTLPRRAGNVLGLCNVRGRLLICISLAHLLGLPSAAPDAGPRKATARLLILAGPTRPVVLPVDEVEGIESFPLAEIGPVPATVTGAQFASGVVRHRDRAVGVLDHARLLRAIERSLA